MVFVIGEAAGAAGNIADQVRRLTKLEESKGVAIVVLPTMFGSPRRARMK